MSTLGRGLLALAAVAAVLLGLPAPASAHGTLAMSQPAQGATVTAPLGSVELFFTEKVPDNAYFAITAPGGARVDNGWEHAGPRPLDKPVTEYFMVNGKFEPRQYTTGFPARVRVAHLPVAGEYKVDYASKASDGDPVHGSVTFKYTGPVTPAPAGWAPPTGQADPALGAGSEGGGAPASAAAVPNVGAPGAAVPGPGAPSAAADDGNGSLFAWLGVAAAVALAAGFLVWRRRNPRSWRASARWSLAGDGSLFGAKKPTGGRSSASSAGSGQTPSGGSGASAAQGERRRVPVVPVAVGAVIVAVIGGYALGRTTAPATTVEPAAAAPRQSGGLPAAYGATGHQHGAGDGGAATLDASGTTVSSQGYTLQPVQRSQPRGSRTDYTFRIVGPDGQPATRYQVVHDKPLHLVVAGRDLGGFQHLHPTMAPGGLWSVPLTLPAAGTYRVFADFTLETTAGAAVPLVLGVDHHVPGDAAQVALAPPAPKAEAGPFTVAMEGSPRAGATVPVQFRVTRTGAPGPATLERYLGSYGHLVVLRQGDLGYLHVHPEPELSGGAVKFSVSVPSAGRYRAFLEFQVDGTVNRAEFTLDV
jgi:methionine-rich copper-binding protein CopC